MKKWIVFKQKRIDEYVHVYSPNNKKTHIYHYVLYKAPKFKFNWTNPKTFKV